MKLDVEMAYRELFVQEIKEVLRLWVRGRGYRMVARRTSVDRKTVRRYAEAAEALGLSRDEESRPLDCSAQLIHHRFALAIG